MCKHFNPCQLNHTLCLSHRLLFAKYHMFRGKYAYFSLFDTVNEFYVFHQQLSSSHDELLADNYRYINGDIYVEP